MDCVTAEVPEEISVLFEDRYFYAGAGQEKPSIMPAGPRQHATTSVSTVPSAPLLGLRKHLQRLYLTRAFVLARSMALRRGGAKC